MARHGLCFENICSCLFALGAQDRAAILCAEYASPGVCLMLASRLLLVDGIEGCLARAGPATHILG